MEIVTLTRHELDKMLNDIATDAAERTVESVRHALTATPADYLFKPWLTTNEACKLLGRRDTEAVLALRDKIDHRREGRGYLWRRSSILDYIEHCDK